MSRVCREPSSAVQSQPACRKWQAGFVFGKVWSVTTLVSDELALRNHGVEVAFLSPKRVLF
jgi:hypothetical protein